MKASDLRPQTSDRCGSEWGRTPSAWLLLLKPEARGLKPSMQLEKTE